MSDGAEKVSADVLAALDRASNGHGTVDVLLELEEGATATAEATRALSTRLLATAAARTGHHPERRVVMENMGYLVLRATPALVLDLAEAPEVVRVTLNKRVNLERA